MDKATEWMEKERETALVEAVELTLPSGMVILARRPDPVQLVAWNKLPLILAGAAAGETDIVTTATDEAQIVQMAGFYRDVLVYCCVDPRVSLTPQAGEIHPQKIPHGDWTFILNWAMRVEEAAALRSFRSERADGGHRRDGQGVRSEAVEPTRDSRLYAVPSVRPGGGGEVTEGTGGDEG